MATATNICSLIIFSGSLAVGQLMFKFAGTSIRGLPLSDGLLRLAALPVFYAALALYAFSTILWVWILSRVSLTQAYPWTAAGVVTVPILSRLVFGEKVSPVFWVGAAMVVVGILITQLGVEN